MYGNGKHARSIFRHSAFIRRPNFISIKVGVAAPPTAREEGVGQHNGDADDEGSQDEDDSGLDPAENIKFDQPED